jgi:hypothetical protein
VRGDDQSSRYPPRGVWFGLILLLGMGPVLFAQDEPDATTARRLQDPIVLAGRRVTEWSTAEGRWVHLFGKAAVLQGVEGLRAQEAVVRIVEQLSSTERTFLVEVYAEGDVSVVGGSGVHSSRHAVFQTAKELQLSPYERSGLTRLKQPPRPSPLLLRSGFLVPRKPDGVRVPSGSGPIEGRGPEPATTLGEPAGGVPTATPGRFDGNSNLQTISRRDPAVQPAQFVTESAPRGAPTATGGRSSDSQVAPARAPQGVGGLKPPNVDLPPIEATPPEVQVPNLAPNPEDLPPNLAPLPGPDGGLTVPSLPPTTPEEEPGKPAGSANLPIVGIMPGSQRVTTLVPRSSRPYQVTQLPTTPEGADTYIFRGGIILIVATAKSGTIDIEADEAVIWLGPTPKKGEPVKTPNGEFVWEDDDKRPMEVYLEGNVILRQDENKWAGKSDQRTVRAPRMYYNFVNDRFVAPNAELDVFAPGLFTPFRVKSPRIEQFRALVPLPNGTFALAEQPEIRAEHTVMTGSRFPDPGYQITSRSVDLTRYSRPATDKYTGKPIINPKKAEQDEEVIWHFDARQNFYWMGPFPTFYWPRMSGDVDDLEPPFRQLAFSKNAYFGEMVMTDWNAFRFLEFKRPDWIDQWNIDIDYLSSRTRDFPALGSEMGWFGTNLFRDLTDPYHRDRTPSTYVTQSYFGYFDIWGLKDAGVDDLGTGPAIVTNGPFGAGKAGFQRGDQPPFQDMRGRFNFRHNQRFLPDDDDEHQFQELRLQLEVAYASDRNFIEEYYKQLFDRGSDQETLADLVWQKDNQFANLWTEANLQNWYTDTQWLPRVDYYRLGDSFFDNRFTYYTHSGMDYATIHTDIMVNNPNLFAYMPYDPISNTSGTFSSGRFYTNHELDMPMNFGNVVRFVPYIQGQVVGWTDQLGGGPLGHQPSGAMGRYWGAAGGRVEFTAWKQYRTVESELMNVHGLNNKISLFADARAAYSNQKLNSIAVQDDLDDNTYEYVRRYLALTAFTGGILPSPYDPRHLILRQMLSPITATTDVQASMETVQLGIHQRLQTKRGPIGRRRIVDYMTFDGTTTYFPNAARDNFGTPWGQAMYNYQWYIGDRTSIVSSGWFDFFKLVGSQPLNNSFTTGYNPNGLNIITSGVSISRPPRANLYLGYSIIDTGPIKTSAVNASVSYWLSPKWYGTFSQSYDFGDAVSLGSSFAFTRIGADYLTSIGFAVDPQRNSWTYALTITPRLSPGLSAGSSTSMGSFDTRFAPSQ